MAENESIELSEQSGVQFSLSFLIQILGTVVMAVWGYSQLDARISQSEHVAAMHTEKLNAIESNIAQAQDQPISSDHVQNTTLDAHDRELAEIRRQLLVLEERLYTITR
jgi:hypothetical protein